MPMRTSITSIYRSMHLVRHKILKEAGRAECNLRVMVGHFSLLDSIERISTQRYSLRSRSDGPQNTQNHDLIDDEYDDSDSDSSDFLSSDSDSDLETDDCELKPIFSVPPAGVQGTRSRPAAGDLKIEDF